MVLDMLPFQRSPGRLPGRWGWLRYLNFALSLAVVLVLWFGFGVKQAAAGQTAVTWFLVGNAAYYLAGMGLAFALKDNRAFCKLLCPIPTILKLTTRLSLLKIAGDAAR